MNYRQEYRLVPGQRLYLTKINPAATGVHESHEKAAAEIRQQVERMGRLQYLLYADGQQSLLIVLQSPDASGKDGVVRHIFSGMNPQGLSVSSFKQPSAAEAAHDFLWRVHQRTPQRGELAIFNRSHYESVLIERVHGQVAGEALARRFEAIRQFERMLADNGTRILKFFLHISPEEQLERFRQRLEDPMRQWKISESDYAERDLWPKYQEAYEDALSQTSAPWAPWFVIPANHKWYRDLAISWIVGDTLDDMGLRCPPARVDLAAIRKRFHGQVDVP